MNSQDDTYTPRCNSMEHDASSRYDEDYGVELASAKLIGNFVTKAKGELNVEKDSVYGAAILIPQLARSANWPKFLTCLTLRTYVFHVLNIAVQAELLLMISKEESVMDLFSGQMYLCDFGAFLADCPNSPGCIGPGGTSISAPRMYPWGQWVTRVFVRDSLKAVFPDRADDISRNVDPGEYGLESYECRWLCCFIYMVSVMNELYLIVRTWGLLYMVPTRDDSWIEHVEEPTGESGSWLDSVRVQIAGMPSSWKVINFIVVFLPKMFLWKLTAEAGITMLMETASIEDLIVNSVALSFVLCLDEMLCENLMSDATKVMLEKCEGFDLYSEEEEGSYTEAEILKMHGEGQSLRHLSLNDLCMLLPPKLLATFALTTIFVFEYYWTHCQWSAEHRFFSIDMYLPKDTSFSVLNAFLPRFFRVESDSLPYWQMPRRED